MEAVAVFATILLAGVVLYFLITDPVSFFFFGLLIAILLYVLYYFGFVSATAKTDELDITYRPTPVPTASPSTANGTEQPAREVRSPLNEVFYVSNNIFTYDQAPAVCKAYGAELADYSQVENAYNRGAEWCGYGWTSGGVALFPTQEETWRKLQLEVDPSKRIACGRPGINGGYFDPATKFGVNCYGKRPARTRKDDLDMTDRAFAAAVARIKGMVDKLAIYPFNKGEWSEYSGAGKSISIAEADIRGLGAEIKPVEQKISAAGGSLVNTIGSTLEGAYSSVRKAFQ